MRVNESVSAHDHTDKVEGILISREPRFGTRLELMGKVQSPVS
jgi:hypothetical protein